MDSTLLRFSSCFSITYAIFVIITGSLAREDTLRHLHIANGTLEIIQIVLQMIFLFNLKEKVKLHANSIELISLQLVDFLFVIMSQSQFAFLFWIGLTTKTANWKTWSPIYHIFLPFQYIPVAGVNIWDSKITRKFDWINFLWHHAMDYHSKSHIASRNIFSFPFRSDQHWTLESYLSFWRAYRYQRRTRSKLCRQRWQRTIIHFKEKI